MNMQKIADYDEFHYDYKSYWDEREYENMAEKEVLEKLLKQETGNYFVDIGGSFGRNITTYYEKYKHPIIVDYSLETLQKYQKDIKQKYPKVTLVAANAYSLPFKQSSIDAAIMIRVLHHLSDQEGVFKETSRVLSNNGIYILEFANKVHIKAALKWIFSGKFHNFSTNPYQQPTQKNYEGSKEGEDTVFLNFHPKYIKQKLAKYDLAIIKASGASFLRVNFLKKSLGVKKLMQIERFFQRTLSWMNISPSIFFKSVKKSNSVTHSNENIFCCPKCKSDLKLTENESKCTICSTSFKKKGGIWDFRI